MKPKPIKSKDGYPSPPWTTGIFTHSVKRKHHRKTPIRLVRVGGVVCGLPFWLLRLMWPQHEKFLVVYL